MNVAEKRAGADLAERLCARLGEIDQATITRVFAISPPELKDPDYVEGLRSAVTAALEFGIAGLGGNAERLPPVPVALLAQARLAARNRVSLETVLRRYFAGYSLLGDFLIEEAQAAGLEEGEELKRLMRISVALFDHVLNAVSDEYRREVRERVSSSRQRREERIERLLAGELVVPAELSYDLDAHHLGAIASGSGATDFLRELAACLEARLLLVPRADGATWAWFGGRRSLDPREVTRRVRGQHPAGLALSLGEPGEGVAGWRLTHRQAKAALPVAAHGDEPVVCYGEVALVAAALQDRFLADCLRGRYMAPLEEEGDGGTVALATLRAYFTAERNAASAAAALGISRQAVNSRLRVIEERLGSPVNASAAELEVALRARDVERNERSSDPLQAPS